MEEESEEGRLLEPAGSEARPKLLLHVFPSFGLGGVPIRISNIINHFGNTFRHTVIATNGCFDSRSRIDPSLDVCYRETKDSRYGLTGNLLAIRRHLRDIRPDLLLTYNWGAIEWALANNFSPVCPHLHLESGFGPEEATRQIPRRVLTRRLALARAGAIIVPSETLVEIATKVWRIDPGKLRYIPNGIDCDRFARAAEPDAIPGFSRSPDEVVVGTVTPLRPEKNLARLIRAFARSGENVKARLLIVGEGGERERLTRLVEELALSDKVFFAGHIESVEQVLGLFDIYALSSDTEQMPNSLLQAMAAGLPVAALDVGDVKKIVAEANQAFVTARDDEDGFCRSLERLLQDRSMRRDLGEANRLRVSSVYGQACMFQAYANVFEGLL